MAPTTGRIPSTSIHAPQSPSATLAPVIATEGLGSRLGGRVALHDVTFRVPEGVVCGLVGANGAGKTTLLRVLATLLVPDEGRATVGGYSTQTDPAEVRALIGYMPELPGAHPRLTAQEYLEFYAGVHKLPRAQGALVAEELLDVVGLSERRHEDVERLSRGQVQRLSLARALVHDPAVLLLDEPAGGIDPVAQVDLQALISALATMGKTVLISSHNLGHLEATCTWIGVLHEGRMVAEGPLDQVRRAEDGDLAGAFRRLTTGKRP